ncbi:MAG: sulfurtransferase [Gammaproteobacteria bacterium]
MHTTIINVEAVHAGLHDSVRRIVDCRFDFADKAAGRGAYLTGHIPGAVYADLEMDLSGPPVTDRGRHPLPTPEHLEDLFSRLGISGDTQVIAYDQVAGSLAGRLWWLLRYMGHDAVAVLDGGWQAWLAAGFPARSGLEQCPSVQFHGNPRRELLVTVDQVPQSRLLVDSRDPVRYRGEVEPLDPRAGHIPGAANRFWKENLQADGRFKASAVLRKEFADFLGGIGPGDAVFYCGSGVTACHNILSVVHAGLTLPKLYAGSWSDWCSVPERPVAVGEEKR